MWYYSFIAGAGPSVLRASLMASFLRKSKGFLGRYNTLFASAFILLWYRPEWIFHIGFQLSFLAVLSILIFQKPCRRLVSTRLKMLKPIEELVSITLAAQILTIPICCYYFKQFPLHFIISNLIAVPLSTFLIYLLLFHLIFHF